MTRYRAVLIDAAKTLWRPRSPIEPWSRILADLGFDVPTERVRAAWETEWQVLGPQFRAFESSGHTNEPADIEAMWKASEKRMVHDLGLTVDP